MKYYDVKDVKKAADGNWAGVLGGLGVDAQLLTNKHSPCPGCGGKDRFRFDDKNGEGTWMCSGGGDFQAGDGVALLMHVLQVEWKVAVNKLGEYLQLDGKVYERRDGGVAGGGVVHRAPAKDKPKMNELFNHDLLRETVAGVQDVSWKFLMDRSPVDPTKVTSGEFLEAIFEPGERALVFTNFFSQGDYGYEVGRGGFRLAQEQGVQAVKSRLPIDGGKDGIWYLSNPVSLGWEANPRADGKMSRRGKECVTAWRYLVLESDEGKHLRAEGKVKEAIEFESNWLKWLAAFPDPIRAIYSSAGGSLHALVHTQCTSWAHMDGVLKGADATATRPRRRGAKEYWSAFGADPGALTPVRLTRLPGCTRNKREQKLIYLNPEKHSYVNGENLRIVDLVARRSVK